MLTKEVITKKVVVIGPESTGKTTLCEQLAAHYHTEWVKEYAREYLLKHGMDYSYEDLLVIAKGQIAAEESGIRKTQATDNRPWTADKGPQATTNQFLFIDTDMYVIKVWGEFVFQQCHHWVLNRIVERKYDLYLLCDIDLPWIKDELREYPDLENRRKLSHYYKDLLVNQHVPWAQINGNYEERLEKAIKAVNQLT